MRDIFKLYITCIRAKNSHILTTLLPPSPVINNLDNAILDPGEDTDALIVPRPGQVLYRAAHTRIRQPRQTVKEPIGSMQRNAGQA